jgi:endonuclease-3 related protein
MVAGASQMTEELRRERYRPPGVDPVLPAIPDTVWGRLLQRLWDRWGDPYWWPGRDAWEVAVGAVLTQNTAWTNVERALANLRDRGLTTPNAVLSADNEELAQAIQPSGYYNMKAKKLRALARWWLEHAGAAGKDIALEDETDTTGAVDDETLRASLLSVWGVGPETADSIACYAFGRPQFVVDAYTIRMIRRVRGMESPEQEPASTPHKKPNDLAYTSLQAEVHEQLPRHTFLYNALHGLIVVLGKYHCTARIPRCQDCPLLRLCAYGQAVTG